LEEKLNACLRTAEVAEKDDEDGVGGEYEDGVLEF